MELFKKILTKHSCPNVSGWYDTNKDRLYWFSDKEVWSCRQDRVSEEFPAWWLEAVAKDSNREQSTQTSGFTGIMIATSPEMILAFKKASLDYAKVICLGHIDEETKVVPPMPTGVKEIACIPIEPLIESYCPRKNDNNPWLFTI